MRRGMCCAVMVSMLSALMACSSAPRKDDVAANLAVQEQVNEKLASADQALKQGKTDQALEQIDLAIKADPSSKAPWLKRAQIHFDARQYGLAITEAQEVLQRDVNDLTAKSISAVSGLRVSAQALEQLRKANEVNGSTRSEAESVAKLIREALGEPILVSPTPATAAEAPRGGRPLTAKGVATRSSASAARSNPNVVTGSVATASTRPASVNASSTGASSGGRNNPFGALQ